jgi:hypothetical protein
LIDVEDDQLTISEDGGRRASQAERIPFGLSFRITTNVAIQVLDVISREELLRRCAGGSARRCVYPKQLV